MPYRVRVVQIDVVYESVIHRSELGGDCEKEKGRAWRDCEKVEP